jgi:hypothetical protein
MTQPPQPLEQLAKSLFWSLPGQFQQQFYYWSIAIRSRLVVMDRAWQTNGRASLPFAQTMLCLQENDQLALRGWP